MSNNGPHARPRHPETGESLPRTSQPGYYPGFQTLSQRDFWDDATRRLVDSRVRDVPPIGFFSAAEMPLMQCLCDHLLPQGDRQPEQRVPIVNYVDERLASGRIPGYRFDIMPPDGDAYRLGFAALDRIAQTARDTDFLGLDWDTQEALLKSLHDAEPWPGAEEMWRQMPVHRWWALVMGDIASAYYAHPWGWDEAGFGGPAYPRGYMRLSHGEAEPWEVDERRYDWVAPEGALSDPSEPEKVAHRGLPAQGQMGTH